MQDQDARAQRAIEDMDVELGAAAAQLICHWHQHSRAGVGVRRILQDGGLDSALAVLIFSATGFSADGVGARSHLRGAVLVEIVMLVAEHPRNPAIDGPERLVLDVAFAVDKFVAPFDSHHVIMLRDGVVRPPQKRGARGS